MKHIKRRLIAHSFVIVQCPHKECGLHLIGLDPHDNPVCEMVIASENVGTVIDEIQRLRHDKPSVN